MAHCVYFGVSDYTRAAHFFPEFPSPAVSHRDMLTELQQS